MTTKAEPATSTATPNSATPNSASPVAAVHREAPREASIGRSSTQMAIGTLFSRLTGAVRSVLLVSFGLKYFTDAYNTANTVPNLIYELVAGGVLSATLIPMFAQLQRKGTRRAREGIDAVVTLVTVLMAITSFALAIAAPWIVSLMLDSGENPLKYRLAAKLLPMFAAQVFFYGMVTVCTAFLNLKRRFFAPMITPVFNNIVVILVLVIARRMLNNSSNGADDLAKTLSDRGTRLLLGFGTTAGVATMAVMLLVSTSQAGVRPRWRWEPDHPAIREIVRVSGWTFGYVVCNLAAYVPITRLLNRTEGDLAAYQTAFSVFFQLPHGLFAVSIASAIQPRLAEAFLDRKRGRFRLTLRDGIIKQLTLMVPAAAAYLVLAEPIVKLLRFAKLDDAGAARIADVLRAFAVGLPAFSVFLLLMNACRAMRNPKLAFQLNAFESALNLIFAGGAYALGFGVRGLAFGYGAAYIVGAIVAFFVVGKKTRGLGTQLVSDALGRILLATLVMSVGVYGTSRGVHALVGPEKPIDLVWRLATLIEVGLSSIAGVTVYLIVGRLFGLQELAAVSRMISRRLKPKSA